jgi:hypothetical protein
LEVEGSDTIENVKQKIQVRRCDGSCFWFWFTYFVLLNRIRRAFPQINND